MDKPLFTKRIFIALTAILLVIAVNFTLANNTETIAINSSEQLKEEVSHNFEVVKTAIDALKSNRQDYLHNFWTTLGFFVVAIGWILTSKESKLFLCQYPCLRVGSIVLVLGLFAIHVLVLKYTYDRSLELLCMLQDLNVKNLDSQYLPDLLIEYYHIQKHWLLVDGAIVVALLAFLVISIYRTKDPVTGCPESPNNRDKKDDKNRSEGQK